MISAPNPSAIRSAKEIGWSCAREADIEAAVTDVLSNAKIASHVEKGANQISMMPNGASVAVHVDAFVSAFR
jgi:hypothetical protein